MIAPSEKQSWIFRVASAPAVGGGHMHRCLSLAEALSPFAAVHFVLDQGAVSWAKKLNALGYSVSIEEVPSGQAFSGCLIDSYSLQEADYLFWREQAGFLVVVSDFSDPGSLPDLIIQPNAAKPLRRHFTCLSGWEYALLDPIFSRLKSVTYSDKVSNILLSFGQSDEHNAIGKMVGALSDFIAEHNSTFSVNILLSRQARFFNHVVDQVNALGQAFRLVVDAASVSSEMKKADLVIGSAGVGLLETMAMGLPSLTLLTADNQRDALAGAVEAGATLTLGVIDAFSSEDLTLPLASLINDFSLRERMGRAAAFLIDGNGPARVAKAMLDYQKSCLDA